MKILKTKFKDLLIIESQKYLDKRGEFREILVEKNIKIKFPFNVISKSKKNVIRGLHYQIKKPQGKFISVIKGEILDVALDLRKRSKTYGKTFSIKINDRSDFSIFIPENFAHGFLCLSKFCAIYYKCTNYRDPKSETTIKWNDPTLSINWSIKNPILSNKDRKGIFFKIFNF